MIRMTHQSDQIQQQSLDCFAVSLVIQTRPYFSQKILSPAISWNFYFLFLYLNIDLTGEILLIVVIFFFNLQTAFNSLQLQTVDIADNLAWHNNMQYEANLCPWRLDQVKNIICHMFSYPLFNSPENHLKWTELLGSPN